MQGSDFAAPELTGKLQLGGGKYMSLKANGSWSENVDIYPDVFSFVQYPVHKNNTVTILLEKTTRESELNCHIALETVDITLGKLQLTDMRFVTNYHVGDPEPVVLAIDGALDLGSFGKIGITGQINNTRLELHGSVDQESFGLRFCGEVETKLDIKQKCHKTTSGGNDLVPCVYVQMETLLNLGVLGTASFSG